MVSAAIETRLDLDDEQFDSFILRISDLVNASLYHHLWSSERRSMPKDDLYRQKVAQGLDWIHPAKIDLPEASKAVNFAMWQVAQRLLAQF